MTSEESYSLRLAKNDVLRELDEHQTPNPVMVGVLSSNLNLLKKKPVCRNAKNVRFVLYTKTSKPKAPRQDFMEK